MDIIRPDQKKKRNRRRILYVVAGAALLALAFLGLTQLDPAAPAVGKSTLWIDTVQRGTMVRQVRGVGSLVPEEIWWIPAPSESRVERILVQPGSAVTANTVLIVLSDPELEQRALEAEYQLKAAQAELRNLKVQLESQTLERRALLASARSEYRQAKLRSETDRALQAKNLNTGFDTRLSESKEEELRERYQLETKRATINVESVKAQLAVQGARIEQYRAALALMRHKVAALNVRAGIDGVLQQLPVQVGQRVTLGTTLAKVAQPTRLKAELKIPETQAKDVMIGQKVSVDTRNGLVPGRVIRIDPAVQGGTVTVDVALEGELPKGARPDLSVDGTIELERLESVLYVGRPSTGGSGSLVGLFRLDPDGSGATRVQVQFGRSSVGTIEIMGGLNPGDHLILSDMSQWDGHDRVVFK